MVLPGGFLAGTGTVRAMAEHAPFDKIIVTCSPEATTAMEYDIASWRRSEARNSASSGQL